MRVEKSAICSNSALVYRPCDLSVMQNPPFVITNGDHRTCGPPMKISQLRNLTVVIEAGTVRQAAKHLNLSQSSVTKSIHQLEETLGVELLRRSSHGVMPTEAGRALVARAKVIDAELRHARNDIDAIRGANFGEIRVSASPTVAMSLLPRAIVAFQHARPRVSFRIEEGVYPDVLPSVRTGDLDFAICLVPDQPRDDTLSFETLLEDRVVPAVRADHPMISARRLESADLLKLDWVVYRRGRTGLDVVEQTFRVFGLEPPKSTIQCTSFACALALVEGGDYVTLVPSQFFAGPRRSLAIAPLLLDFQLPSWNVAVISRVEHELSAVCRAFLAELHRTAAKIRLPRSSARPSGRTRR